MNSSKRLEIICGHIASLSSTGKRNVVSVPVSSNEKKVKKEIQRKIKIDKTAISLRDFTEFSSTLSKCSGEMKNVKQETQQRANAMIMRAAAASALVGVTLHHGGPFGACVVRNGIFVSVAHNTVLLDSDSTCHAEMNAIRYACEAMDSHDLSDCELYTTCEPCPMCWGAIQWARLRKVYMGVDRFTAAEFGFDDKVFYDEVNAQCGRYAVKPYEELPNTKPAMLEVFGGVEELRVMRFVSDVHVNKTFRRRAGPQSFGFRDDGARFSHSRSRRRSSSISDSSSNRMINANDMIDGKDHTKYFEILEEAVRDAVKNGINKEREVFASIVVKDSKVISLAVNEVIKRRDATATSEILAIRYAAKILGTHVLSGCCIYSTIEPDVMSMGAILWARIDTLYYGMCQKSAARFGFEEGLLQYRELFMDRDIVQEYFAVENKVGFEDCANVFREWKKVNAIIY